jgi:hypothetical protein
MRSAPKDGTPFLCYGPCEDAERVGWAVCYLSTDRTLCLDATDSIVEPGSFTPTHWMPLPEKPQ